MPKPLSNTSGSPSGTSVPVSSRIEEEIRGLQHEDAAVAEAHAGGEVEAADEVLGLAEMAVLVGVGQDGDAVGPFRPLRRRLRHAVVDGAQVLVDLDRLESGGSRILQVLNDPHAARVVEGDRDRLADVRLGGDELDLQVVGDLHALDGLLGREALGGESAGAGGADQRGGEASEAEAVHRRILGSAGRRRGGGSGIQSIVRRGGRGDKREGLRSAARVRGPIRRAVRKAVRPTRRALGCVGLTVEERSPACSSGAGAANRAPGAARRAADTDGVDKAAWGASASVHDGTLPSVACGWGVWAGERGAQMDDNGGRRSPGFAPP